jgi:SAM-dependent methyltransferase
VPIRIGFADLRPLFKNKKYVGCDMREGPGVDKILNLPAIGLLSESVGMVLCFDTLEHVEHPRKALEEILRILMPNGIAVISSAMDYPIHDHPHDYWRFTPEAFKSILKPFSNSFVGFQGNERFPHTVVGIGLKNKTPSLLEFKQKYAIWDRKNSFTQISLKLIPPILLPIFISFNKNIAGKQGAPPDHYSAAQLLKN